MLMSRITASAALRWMNPCHADQCTHGLLQISYPSLSTTLEGTQRTTRPSAPHRLCKRRLLGIGELREMINLSQCFKLPKTHTSGSVTFDLHSLSPFQGRTFPSPIFSSHPPLLRPLKTQSNGASPPGGTPAPQEAVQRSGLEEPAIALP